MAQSRGDLDLAGEALGAQRAGELGSKDLERDAAPVPEIVGQIDGGHAALAELAFDEVGTDPVP